MKSFSKQRTVSSRLKLSTCFLILSLALSACGDQVPAQQNRNDDQEISDAKRDKDAAITRAADAERAKTDAEAALAAAQRDLQALKDRIASGGGSGGSSSESSDDEDDSDDTGAATGGMSSDTSAAIAAAHALELQALQEKVADAEEKLKKAQLAAATAATEAAQKLTAAEAAQRTAEGQSQASKRAQEALQADLAKVEKELANAKGQTASTELALTEARKKLEEAEGKSSAAAQSLRDAEARALEAQKTAQKSKEAFEASIAKTGTETAAAKERADADLAQAKKETTEVRALLAAAQEKLTVAVKQEEVAKQKLKEALDQQGVDQGALAKARQEKETADRELKQAQGEKAILTQKAATAEARAYEAEKAKNSFQEAANKKSIAQEQAYKEAMAKYEAAKQEAAQQREKALSFERFLAQALKDKKSAEQQRDEAVQALEALTSNKDKIILILRTKINRHQDKKAFRQAHHRAYWAILKEKNFIQYYQDGFPPKTTDQQRLEGMKKLFTHMALGAEHPEKRCAELWWEMRFPSMQPKNGTLPACERALVEACGNVFSAKYFTSSLHTLSARTIQNGTDQPIFGMIEVLKQAHSAEAVQAEATLRHEPNGNVQPPAPWGYDFINIKEHLKKDLMKVVSSPRYLNPEKTALNPERHSEHLLEAWTQRIASAKSYVDITTLSVPESKFRTQLLAAIQELDRRTKDDVDRTPIPVRLLFGPQKYIAKVKEIFDAGDPREVLNFLKDGLAANSRLVITTGNYDASYLMSGAAHLLSASWNHSKIVAVDGEWMFTGGHNLYAGYVDHQVNEPIHDLSLQIYGKLARAGHNFANILWNYAQLHDGAVHTYDVASKTIKSVWPQPAPVSVVVPDGELGPGEEPILALARLANAGFNKRSLNVCDTSILHIIRSAQKSLFISQQAVLPLFTSKHHKGEMNEFNKDVFQALQERIEKGVHVFILTSSDQQDKKDMGVSYNTYTPGPTFLAGGLPPPNESRWATFDHFFTKQFKDRSGFKEKDAAVKLTRRLFKYLHVLPAASGLVQVRNHSKVVIADGNMAYVGSHNAYDGSHAENGLGFAREGSEVLTTEVYAPLWYSSLLHSISKKLKPVSYNDLKVGDVIYVPAEGDPAAGVHWTLARVTLLDKKIKVVDRDFLSYYETAPLQFRGDKRYMPLKDDGTYYMPPGADLWDYFDAPLIQ